MAARSGDSDIFRISAFGLQVFAQRMSIELQNVSKRFGDIAAVNQVSFAVKEGELVGLLGPSGGGKTTVLRMIAGLEMPTDGDVFIRERRTNPEGNSNSSRSKTPKKYVWRNTAWYGYWLRSGEIWTANGRKPMRIRSPSA